MLLAWERWTKSILALGRTDLMREVREVRPTCPVWAGAASRWGDTDTFEWKKVWPCSEVSFTIHNQERTSSNPEEQTERPLALKNGCWFCSFWALGALRNLTGSKGNFFFIWMRRFSGINKEKTNKHYLILGYLVYPSFLKEGKSCSFNLVKKGVTFGTQPTGKGMWVLEWIYFEHTLTLRMDNLTLNGW